MTKPTAIILLILSLGIFYTITSPQYESVKGLSALSQEYKGVLDNISRIMETRDSLLASYEAIPKAEIEKLSKVLPDGIDTVSLAKDLDSIASQYGISINKVEVESKDTQNSDLIVLPEYEAPYETNSVSFSFISNYDNFLKLLRDIEMNLRIMDIKSATFEVGEGSLYEHSITVDTYWLR